jgi:hypothetical protein
MGCRIGMVDPTGIQDVVGKSIAQQQYRMVIGNDDCYPGPARKKTES